MNENKAQICTKLGELLKLTRAGEDIDKIEYDAKADCVAVYFKDIIPYGIRMVATEGDSGAQLIADVVREILR